MTTRLWFETHAITTDNEAHRATGWLPGVLAEAGAAQHDERGERISRRRPDAIFTSDLDRAVATARGALAHADLEVRLFLDWRLRECDYGELNSAAADRVHADRLRHLTDPYPGGESWTVAVERAEAAITDAVARFRGGTVLIYGHAATRFAVQRVADGTPLEDLLTAPFGWRPGWAYDVD